MSRVWFAAALVCALVLCSPGVALASRAAPVTVGDLTGARSPEDGALVVFEGEAIGEAINESADGVWVNVLAEGAAIGVVVSREQAERIGSFGEYRRVGDAVRVTGRFERACDEHGGDRDVHAETLEVTREGGPTEHPIHWWKGAVGIAAAALGALQVRHARTRRTPH